MSELNAEQQAILESLINPLAETKSSKYELDEDVQRHILGMVMTDRQFMNQSKGLVEPQYFVNIAHQEIYKSICDFYEKYKTLPHKLYIRNELKKRARDEIQLNFFYAELDLVVEYYIPNVEDREYLLDEITHFAKTEAMRIAFGKCVKMLNGSTPSRELWSQVGEILRNAQLVERDLNIGLDYFNTVDERYDRSDEKEKNSDRFETGFQSIDFALTGGLERGEIGAWIALPGAGKSLALVKGAVINLCKGKKVLFISLEMDQDKIAARFDAQLTNHNVGELRKYRKDIKNSLELFLHESGYEDRKRLIIKQFPGGTADVNTIRAYMHQLEMQEGFDPDLVVIDYVGEMKDLPGMPVHESREKLIRQLRALGVENNHCTFTALQPNRSAKEAQENSRYIDDSQIGDSYNQFRPLDAFWSINQTLLEKDQGLGRVFVIKHRNGESKFGFRIGYDYGPGKPREDGVCSLRMFEIDSDEYNRIMNLARENIKEGTKMDSIPLKKAKLGNKSSEAIEGILGSNYNN